MIAVILALLAGCVPSLIVFIIKKRNDPKYAEVITGETDM